MEYEKISMIILSLPLIQEWYISCQLLAKEWALTVLVNHLGGLPWNSVDKLTYCARNDFKSVEEP